MKWIFKFLIFIFVFTQSLGAKEFLEEYKISTKGITIGKLLWSLKLNEINYSIDLKLKDKGIFSGLYKFKGEYSSKGHIKDNILFPSEYKQFWETKKKSRTVVINFKNKKITNLKILPKEREFARINVNELVGYIDPLTSFVNILIKENSTKTIDGRRIYTLQPTVENRKTKILVQDYINIWADHKRNDLNYIEFFSKKNGLILPTKIIIGFKGSVFTLSKN